MARAVRQGSLVGGPYQFLTPSAGKTKQKPRPEPVVTRGCGIMFSLLRRAFTPTLLAQGKVMSPLASRFAATTSTLYKAPNVVVPMVPWKQHAATKSEDVVESTTDIFCVLIL